MPTQAESRRTTDGQPKGRPSGEAAAAPAGARWLVRLESRDFATGAQWLAIALIVGTLRLLEERVLIPRSGGGRVSFLGALHMGTFYVQVIWLYTAAAAFLTKQPWRRTLGPETAQIVVGLLPPLLDAAIYGIGRFSYTYQFDFLWQGGRVAGPGLQRGLPWGEALVSYACVLLLALYVAVRSYSYIRTSVALLVGLSLVYTVGIGTPSLVAHARFALHIPLIVRLTLAQVMSVVVLYGVINPHLFRQTARRWPYILACPMLVLMGGAIGRQPMEGTLVIVLVTTAVTAALSGWTVAERPWSPHELAEILRLRLRMTSIPDGPAQNCSTPGATVMDRQDRHFMLAVSVLFTVTLAGYRVALGAILTLFCLLAYGAWGTSRPKQSMLLRRSLQVASVIPLVVAGLLGT